MPATAGGSTSGSSTSVTTQRAPGKRRVARRYAAGVPNRRISACAISARLELTIERVATTGFESWSISSPGRDVREDREHRQHEERERDRAPRRRTDGEQRFAAPARARACSAMRRGFGDRRQEARRQQLRLTGRSGPRR